MPVRKANVAPFGAASGRRNAADMSTGETVVPSSGAIFDSSSAYRYLLWREWDIDAPRIVFVMLNPSTADATRDDPTIRRCISFAKRWSFGSLDVVNLFAYRVTEPSVLAQVADPIGPDNDWYIKNSIAKADKVIVAWGNHGSLLNRSVSFERQYLSDTTLHCFGMTDKGQPMHPLYVRLETIPVHYGASSIP